MKNLSALALGVLVACKGTAAEPSSVPTVAPSPRCRGGAAPRIDREQPTQATTLSLSLAHFGPFPTAAEGVGSWAAAPAAVHTTCRTVGTAAPPAPGFYRGGGFIQTFCVYELGTQKITNERELAAALIPIDSPRKALAMVALSHKLAYEPDARLPAITKPVHMATSLVKKGVPRAFDFVKTEGGYQVWAPVQETCPVAVVRTAFRVTTAGVVCEADEPSQLLDAGSGVCVD